MMSIPDNDTLGLPSEFTSKEREDFRLSDFGKWEMTLRETQALNTLQSVRRAVKAHGVIAHNKAVQHCGQAQNM